MTNNTLPEACSLPQNSQHPASSDPPPFSPLGWSVWGRLALSATACAVLWAVVLWALD